MEELKDHISSALKKCCCCTFVELLFARVDQARYILQETFDGRHFFVKGESGNKIDCMFFPCTDKEPFTIDYEARIDGLPGVGNNWDGQIVYHNGERPEQST